MCQAVLNLLLALFRLSQNILLVMYYEDITFNSFTEQQAKAQSG